MDKDALSARLAVFVEQGLIARVPTRWQVLQGTAEMIPYLLTPDPYDRTRYAGAPFGHPLVRSPLLVAYTFGAHFKVGSGIWNSERLLHKHLFSVHHEGQPVYDLQLAQTYPGGLQNLRDGFLAMRSRATWQRRLERAFVGTVVPRWDAYCDAMLGHIDRAARFDYDPAPVWCRQEFWSLTSFASYCAATFPPTLRAQTPWSIAGHLIGLVTRKFRDPS